MEKRTLSCSPPSPSSFHPSGTVSAKRNTPCGFVSLARFLGLVEELDEVAGSMPRGERSCVSRRARTSEGRKGRTELVQRVLGDLAFDTEDGQVRHVYTEPAGRRRARERGRELRELALKLPAWVPLPFA